jgi:uncharacterized protein
MVKEERFMKNLLYIFIIFTTLLWSDTQNKLSSETSPYLLQHASNPIHWYPWGDEAFAKAKRENKAVFLSIGYATCHWCHVMARESFKDEKIAEVFNKYFVCVKVDKEELSHLDSYYQRLHIEIKGRIGGWPLSAFLTHDKKPFYIASYIPPTKKSYHEGLDTLLPSIAKSYMAGFTSFKNIDTATQITKNQDVNISVASLMDSIEESYDDIYSGFGRGKKFPESSKLSLMMDLAQISHDNELQKNAFEMLDMMAMRGLYDHVEGGFFRYSVDPAWEIPHFEKMLYNQAALVPLYTRAYLISSKELYKEIVEETIQMLENRFTYKNLYFSASDADTNHKEGEYFIFSVQEIKDALKNNPNALSIRDDISLYEHGNFEGYVHLNFYTTHREAGFKDFKKKLLDIRNKKEYPFIDKKINTAWNSMMIEALYSAYSIDKSYAKRADKHLDALLHLMYDKGELYHQTIIGVKPKQLGLLEDYSFLISALIAGYEVDFDSSKLDKAEFFLAKAKREFYVDGIWYLNRDEPKIKADMQDKYYTSPLAKMTQNIIKLASLKSSFSYEELAIKTLESMNAEIQKSQSNVPASARAFLMQQEGIVTLKNSKKILQRDYLKIKKINYPYVQLKMDKTNQNYLACTMRNCFAIDKKLENIEKSIALLKKRPFAISHSKHP